MLKRDGQGVQVNNACEAQSGTWISPYDNASFTTASSLDIDHMVPLQNAWIVSSLSSLRVSGFSTSLYFLCPSLHPSLIHCLYSVHALLFVTTSITPSHHYLFILPTSFHFPLSTLSLSLSIIPYHTTPLTHLQSGASSWTTAQREALANDVSRPQLWAVSASANRSKGDRSPDQWKPPLTTFYCTYAKSWIDVKSFYELTITSAEKTALSSMLDTC